MIDMEEPKNTNVTLSRHDFNLIVDTLFLLYDLLADQPASISDLTTPEEYNEIKKALTLLLRIDVEKMRPE